MFLNISVVIFAVVIAIALIKLGALSVWVAVLGLSVKSLLILFIAVALFCIWKWYRKN